MDNLENTILIKNPFRQLGLLERLAIATAISWSILGIYMFTANYPFNTPVTVQMPSWVPFWPQAAPVYIALLLVTWLLPVAIRNTRNFLKCQAASLLAYFFAICWWVLLPTRLIRPPLREQTLMQMYELLVSIDPPTNITPCAHGIGPLVAVWFFSYEHPGWRWPLMAAAFLSFGSIAVTYQHRPVDIIIGAGAAVAAVILLVWRGFSVNHNNEKKIAAY